MIAVIALNDFQYKLFLRDIEPEDRKNFRRVSRPEDAYGMEFSHMVRIGEWTYLKNLEELLILTKSRIR